MALRVFALMATADHLPTGRAPAEFIRKFAVVALRTFLPPSIRRSFPSRSTLSVTHYFPYSVSSLSLCDAEVVTEMD